MILPGITGNWASKNAKKVQNLQNKSTAVGSVPPHSHDNSKDASEPIQPVGNITGNVNQNAKVEELGKQFFQGDQFANQYASRPPVDPAMPIPPRPDPIGDQYGNMFSPFSNKNKPVEQKERVQETLPTERVGAVRKTPNKINKPTEMPKQIIPPTNMIGGVKKAKDPNKGKAYVVNKRPNVWQEGTADRSKDTLWLDNKYKKMAGSYIDQDEYDDLARKAHSEGSYKRVGVQDLEGGGEIKIKI